MSERNGLFKWAGFGKKDAEWETNRNLRLFLLIIIFATVIYFIVRNVSTFGNILLTVVGFGMVVLVHEFGHFIVAKLYDIKVETFSIGFPPILAGVLRTERGLRIRILPKFFPKRSDESGEGLLSFTVGSGGKAGETEYCVGLIPFGGFVKMLGQEDVKTVEANEDPRSYANKSVGTRMAVIASGVGFNAISAVVIFVAVFLIGIKLMPPVIGAVAPGSPAERAGLTAGDEIIEIAGKSDNLEFTDIGMAAALSGRNEEIPLKVRHTDGSEETFGIVAEERQTPMGKLRLFGVMSAGSLKIAKVSDANALLERTGLRFGDRIVAVGGRDVQAHWEMEEIVRDTLMPEVRVLAERAGVGSKESELIESQIRLNLNFAGSYEVESESELYHIYSMVPRLRITAVFERPISIKDRLKALLSGSDIAESGADAEPGLERGDIILVVADIENPTYKELRDVVVEYEAKELPLKVLRADANGVERPVAVTVVPHRRPGSDWVEIGILVVLDAEHPVVAKTIATEDGPAKLEIPRGAVITAVDGASVSDFYDVIRQIERSAGRRITVEWRIGEEAVGGVALHVDSDKDFITVESIFAEPVPFEPLEKLYKASGPIDAIGMGYRKTLMFIARAYVTLQRAVGGLVSPENFMGPVGIITLSYRIVAERPLIYYVYFLGLINAFIAVFNFLPMLPFDGGHIVFLLVEKIKGSAVSERVQGAVAYIGLVIVGAFFLYVTFNDILRGVF